MSRAKQRHLAKNSNPHTVRDDYLLRALALLSRHAHLRIFGLAFGMFSDRTRPAAFGAATRVIANAVKQQLVAAFTDPITRHRFYALAPAGARLLREADVGHDHALATTDTLPSTSARSGANPDAPPAKKGMRKWRHREWSSLIAMASDQLQGFVGITEFELQTHYRSQIVEQFSYRFPDAMFVCPSKGEITWHEVEASRRNRSFGSRKTPDGTKEAITSKTVRLANGNDHTQVAQTLDLIAKLNMLSAGDRRFTCPDFYGVPTTCRVKEVVVHTGSEVIFNELWALLVRSYPDNGYDFANRVFNIQWTSGAEGRVEPKLYVRFVPLPASPEMAWPVQGKPGLLPEPNLTWRRKASVDAVQDRAPVKLAKAA